MNQMAKCGDDRNTRALTSNRLNWYDVADAAVPFVWPAICPPANSKLRRCD